MTLPRILFVTGTDTGVGKTITTAALAAALTARGRAVAVYKPCQTGARHGDSDVAEVLRLSGIATAEAGAVLGEPLAPRPAAVLDAARLPTAVDHAARIAGLAATHDHVLVEGAGGLLVELDDDGATLADLPLALGDNVATQGFVLVTRAALGTLNHTALTLEALDRRGLPVVGLVVGSRPGEPGLAERGNLATLSSGIVPLLGAIPERASELEPDRFRAEASTWLGGLVDELAGGPLIAEDVPA
ncbi:dethiobiotin synthase [Sinomonas mesophila]|uniref:dethiobiotin synthase n=1 Tax=Sinomonas mesophila TaxID=1531955 RepID=UPI000984E7F9|nr:dethiobiotin synthase [Sinomonas mesophila]